MIDTDMQFTLVLRSSRGTETDLGTLEVGPDERPAVIKMALAAWLAKIADATARNAWDGPTEPTPWLDNVDLVEFTDTIKRETAFIRESSACGALPARAFRARYPSGCVAEAGHSGNHTTSTVLAERMRRRNAAVIA